MQLSKEVAGIINSAIKIATKEKYEYITPELILYILLDDEDFREAYCACEGDPEELHTQLKEYMDNNLKTEDATEPEPSKGFETLLALAAVQCASCSKEKIEIPHILHAFFELPESNAAYFIREKGIEEVDLMGNLLSIYFERDDLEIYYKHKAQEASHSDDEYDDEADEDSDDEDSDDDEAYDDDGGDEEADTSDEEPEFVNAGAFAGSGRSKRKDLAYAPCLNDTLQDVNPLIGREAELERTIQILCRKDKNNPLHLGEPGVGKTAITYGLVQRLREDRVPDALKGARVYALDLGSTIAGTQYRGEFEKRLKHVLEVVSKDEKPIIYIDEIHNLLGTGATGESTFDAANILKSYLAEGHIRFIGATTFEEYKKHFEISKSLVRRFQNIEINEPTEDETVCILNGLKSKYEEYHGIVYDEGVIEYAVSMSAKYINERFLPDKAIDLIDEAGAYRKIHPVEDDVQPVDKQLIDVILSKICRVPEQSVKAEASDGLKCLEENILGQVFGQDGAVSQVVNAVKFSKAGLLEDGKPLASLLFVGPTGVGKTEIAKTLAKELGVKLIRFDMSEYGEKHAVAKLIGAPAGYVGYEEGGLLTEQIRKNPSSVLLLDEIEKAHPDIYSILLQVMDYATLTDNQGRKADFRNVIIIMTSNAGASRLGKAGMGFQSQDRSSDTLLEEVKHIFQPEFRNRLNRIVVFNGMDGKMAELIAEKKLKELAAMLSARNIEFEAVPEAVGLLKDKGISAEYGAREIDRVIRNDIKPLFVDEILFGSLKEGGRVKLVVKDGKFEVDLINDIQTG